MKDKSLFIAATVIFSIFAVVLLVYWTTFGFHLSDDHSRWAEFGSFFGGFLGVMFAGGSLFYLALQIKNQTEESKRGRVEADLNRAEESIRMYVYLIAQELEQEDEKEEMTLKRAIMNIHTQEHAVRRRTYSFKILFSGRYEIVMMWVALATALTNIGKMNEERYVKQLNLISVQIGRNMCVALDDVIHFTTEFDFPRHFMKEKEE